MGVGGEGHCAAHRCPKLLLQSSNIGAACCSATAFLGLPADINATIVDATTGLSFLCIATLRLRCDCRPPTAPTWHLAAQQLLHEGRGHDAGNGVVHDGTAIQSCVI